MKSSTLKRSTLSKENMEVIEALAKESEKDCSPGEYYRPEEIQNEVEASESDFASKAQEIDLLWQNFKTTQLSSNSPTMYVLMGFVCGIIFTLLVLFGIGLIAQKTGKIDVSKLYAKSSQVQLESQIIEQEAQDNAVSVPTDEQETSLSPSEDASKKSDAEVVDNNGEYAKTSEMKKYVVKSGDTGESIIKHFYGAYTPERAEKIIKANNLKSLDRINIDQELLIPIE